MVQFAGTYQLVETINPAEIIKAAGEEVTDERVAGLSNTNSKFTVEVDGDNYVFLTTIGDAWKRELKFTLGKAFEEGLSGKNTAMTTAKKEGDKIILSSSSGGKAGSRFYEFTDSGVTMVLDVGSGVQAKRIYKRA